MSYVKHRTSQQLAIGGGLACLAVGIALIAIRSGRFDGFAGGFLLGAGVMLIVMGTWLISLVARHKIFDAAREDEAADTWLPSRDGDR